MSKQPPTAQDVDDQDLLDALYAHAYTYAHGHSVGGTNPSLLRAMGAGTAVIAYDVPFNREVLDERAWLFTDSRDVTFWALSWSFHRSGADACSCSSSICRRAVSGSSTASMEVKAKRTLVKSAPELWELAAEEERMRAWMGGLLGTAAPVSVEVTASVPESVLAFRAAPPQRNSP